MVIAGAGIVGGEPACGVGPTGEDTAGRHGTGRWRGHYDQGDLERHKGMVKPVMRTKWHLL